jgi:hypothetical protein
MLAISSVGVMASTQVPDDRKIVKIMMYDVKTILYYAPSFPSSEGCAGEASNPDVAVLDAADDPNKQMLTTVLSAHMAGKHVGLGLSGCHGWNGGVPRGLMGSGLSFCIGDKTSVT